MTKRHGILLAAGAAFALAAGGAGFLLGAAFDSEDASDMAAEAAAPGGADDGREVLYWYDPMVPGQRFDKPGKSPFMDMQLVPKYADEAAGGVRVSPAMVQSLGIRTGQAERTDFAAEVEAVGRIEIDERRIAEVQTLTPGYVEGLSVRAAGEPVRRGQNLATIYAPELLEAQAEYAALMQMSAEVAPASLKGAARSRLRLLGLPDRAIGALAKGGTPQRTYAVFAPVSGVVTEIGALPGARVSAGQSIMTVADLSQVWAIADVPEAALGQIKTGLPVELTFPAYPGESRTGQVDYIYPTLDAQARTARVRVTLSNPGLKLKAGMFANMTIGGTGGSALTVPSEAVIRTGERDIVIVEKDGAFRPVLVEVGREAGERTEILAGLEEGQEIVLSGQFLIDSEAQLSGLVARLESAPAPDETAVFQTSGKVTALDPGDRQITISHGPVPELRWPAMTMAFGVRDDVQLRGLQRGGKVRFTFAEGPEDGTYVIQAIEEGDGS
ncbi:efflux RND transporter periplasmic adaptor subunit [Pacificimonas flava]|uniref:Cobalt/zinc/cadmium efflux RND transporter, membrane fusion protein, CzcB family n=1 Tax=Pacificimonas flava TaxID=1234595 RepID=M2SDD6_9SPHN|nr:efflux RND transporter periplasmic adaptor subunit [Pacificimonas flava]EMD83350.1 Cobalt/zinc/cadmium efflux RND transporter, membrane fusion protein, CzcB family [Pacificimonas flava]MBB5279091.1 Cu(I)/Ag(I) efflux system membrane fusion protein [Pacificimonas flava]